MKDKNVIVLFQMKGVDIFTYFPIPDDDTMSTYLKRDDEFDERKQQLFTVILRANTDTKKKFTKGVINELFSDSYINTHRWPTVG